MSEEETLIWLFVVGILLMGAYSIYDAVRKNKEEEKEEKELQDEKQDFFEKLDTYVENTGYEVGKWDKEVRPEMQPIVKIKTKYKTNKEVNVLIGDYNKSSVSNTACILESMGIKTHIAKSGLEVIKRIKDGEKYDLIISNNIYDRGHLDGPDTLYKLKEIENFNIPVVVLTVSEGERDKFIGRYGFDEYMTKLLTQEQVIETLPKVIKDLKFTKITKKSNKS